MTTFARNSNERLLLDSSFPPGLTTYWYFPFPPAHSQPPTEAAWSLLHFQGLSTLYPGKYLIYSSLQWPFAHGRETISFSLNSLWLVIVSWWPTQFKTQHSVLITLHIQSIALISWSAWSKANHRAACGTGTHRPSVIVAVLCFSELGRIFAPWETKQSRSDGIVQCTGTACWGLGRFSHHLWHTLPQDPHCTGVSQHLYTFCRMGYL